MKFNSPEANKLFRIAIFVEKKADEAHKKFLKKEMTDTDFIKFKNFLGEFINKSSEIVDVKCKDFLNTKGMKHGK